MKNKTIAIIGIGSYISSVITSATDLEGNFVHPIILIAISQIVKIIFTILATVRLWKTARYVSIILASSAIILFVLGIIQGVTLPEYGSAIIILSNVTKIIHFLSFFYAIILLWKMAKYENTINKIVSDAGLTPEEAKALQEDLAGDNRSAGIARIQEAQERHRAFLREQGIEPSTIIPVVGKDIKWTDIVRQVFRVLEFDRADTTVLTDGTVKAATQTKSYGYLLIDSPILNVKARLPIINRDDFSLAAKVYDDPQLAELVVQEELLVTYFPKHKLPMGFAGKTHALHYVIAPRGTLERYYEFNNDEHMANPAPEKLFKKFAWEGEIRVEVNLDPEF